MRIRTQLSLVLLLCLAGHQAVGEQLLLPVPPEQHSPWSASDIVPTNLVSAATTLFAQGFPDPRGCEYRQVTVEVGNVWGEPRFRFGTNLEAPPVSRAVTHGWVLPITSISTQRFAICWNGLIYPVAELGEPANLAEEVANLPRWRDASFFLGNGEMRSVFPTNAGSSRILLLLRSGFIEAAVTNWQAYSQPQRFSMGLRTNNHDPYLAFASDWAWAMFDRAVCAHMRGADGLALATAQTLAALQPQVEAEAARRGFPQQQYPDYPRRSQVRPYLDFLEPLPRLLADSARRVREGERVPALTRGLTNWPASADRIAVLIRDLDLVAVRQWSQPGGVTLTSDPVVTALIAEGDLAVPSLIDCLATDQRLTRSVSFGRDFQRSRNLIPVSSAARAALCAILQTELPTVAAWRAYWQRFGGMRIEERWYALLQDDRAGMAGWLEVARCITRPVNVPGSLYPYTRSLLPPATNPSPSVSGEWLRTKVQPTVSELLSRRALEIVSTNAAGYDLTLACDIGLCLARWDLSAAGPVATKLMQRHQVVNEYSESRAENWEHQRLGTLLAALTSVRARAGEPAPFAEYAKWLPTTSPESFGSYLAQGLAPLLEFPTNQTLQALAERLFGASNSSWTRLPWKGGSNPFETGLVAVPAFRKLLARELEVKTPCGSLTWRGPETISYQVTNATYASGIRILKLSEAERPAEGTGIELRWCDWIAWHLADAKQIPDFNPFAPLQQRDEAIGRAQQLLQESSGR